MTEQLARFNDCTPKDYVLGLRRDFCGVHLRFMLLTLRTKLHVFIVYGVLHEAICLSNVIIADVCPGTSSFVMCIVKVANFWKYYVMVTAVVYRW